MYERSVEIQIDTLSLDSVSSSFTGFATIRENQIYYLDARFGWMYIFDSEGSLQRREMGQGHGPKEIPMTGIQFFNPHDTGFFLVGSSADFYQFDNDLNRTHNGVIRWKSEHPIEYLQQNPVPEAQRSYNLAYDTSSLRLYGDYAYLPLFSAPPGFSEFHLFTDLYASEARILGELNLNTGEVERVFGRFSPIYAQDGRVRTFSIFDFDILPDGELLISYAADSLLHKFDLDFNHIQSFGFSGKHKKRDFSDMPDYSNPNEVQRHMMREVVGRDFYTTLSCIEEHTLCFRSYRISSDSQHDGLQIYRGNMLLADILVPKTGDHRNGNYFQISGYSEPWFYSNIHFDEQNEQKFIYRLQIKDL